VLASSQRAKGPHHAAALLSSLASNRSVRICEQGSQYGFGKTEERGAKKHKEGRGRREEKTHDRTSAKIGKNSAGQTGCISS
jgi:hypothetical protein